MDSELLTTDPSNVPAVAPMSEIGHLIEVAMQIDNFDMQKFEKLLQMKRDEEDRERERLMQSTFLAAKAKFLVKCPDIPHDKHPPWGSYASLGAITKIVGPELGKQGLSIQWRRTPEEVACILTHNNGYSQESSFPLSIEGQQGGLAKMTLQQRMGAADTYAERRALKAVCGLGTVDEDRERNLPAEKAQEQSEAQQSHGDIAQKIKDDWLAPRHELHSADQAEKHRRFAAWFLEHTDAKTFSPVVARWTAQQLKQCREQLDKEAQTAQYAKESEAGDDVREPDEQPTTGESEQNPHYEGEADG